MRFMRLINAILFVFYYVSFTYFYEASFQEIWEYEGFRLNYSANRASISIVLLAFITMMHGLVSNNAYIYNVANLFIVLVVIPNLVFFRYHDIPVGIPLSCVYFVLCIILVGRIKVKFNLPSVGISTLKRILPWFVLVALVPFVLTFGFSFSAEIFLLIDIYDVRLKAREIDNVFTGYLSGWLTNVILPIFIVVALDSKKPIQLVIPILAFLYLFTCFAQKFVLFSIPLTFLFYYFSEERKSLVFNILVVLMIAWIHYNDITYGPVSLPSIGAKAIILNRTFFAPAMLNSFYWDFFTGRPLFLSDSVLRSLIEYPFDALPPRLIGSFYFNNADMAANNGVPSDGYMGFGYSGVAVYSLIIASIFAFIANMKVSHRFFVVTVTIISSFISTTLFTTLLTSGVLLFLLLTILFLKDSSSKMS
jgi:hypothetical protein